MNLATVTISIYKIVTRILHHFIPYLLRSRLKKGKEDPAKYLEKLGIYQTIALREQLKIKEDKEVIWFQAASLGEFNAIKPLLKKLDDPNRYFLISTTTTSGAAACELYKNIQPNVFHVFNPLDTPQAVEAFFNFWHPNALILVESEIWPNLVMTAAKRSSFCIINGSLSEKSFRKWSYFRFLLKEILKDCAFIAADSRASLYRYSNFNDRVSLTGNLKCDAEPLKVDLWSLELLKKSIGSRKVFVCASTHPGEEKILLQAYKELYKKFPDILMIIVPRHVQRADEIAKLCFENHLTSILREAKGEVTDHVPSCVQIYIANTMRELGLFFKLSKIVFLGGSLVEIGGHNLCEPALLECAIITGKYLNEVKEIADEMQKNNAMKVVAEETDIIEIIIDLIQNPEKIENMGSNAKKLIEANRGALDKTIELLKKHGVVKS